jgi:1-acyl-sn-glycerol-3-phosphate acyltransferase
MTRFFQWLFEWVVKVGTAITCKIDREDLKRVPARGPLILAVNHIGSLEVPLLVAYLQPRQMIGLAKIETWDNKFMGWIFNMWDSIPIRRGEVDLQAMRKSLNTLADGKILAIAPEGTRSYDGKLARGYPGITAIALRSGAPILPLAHWGSEDFSRNIKKGKRTDFHIRLGKPFTLDVKGKKVNAEFRQQMADEIMYQIAMLMPEKYRGQYANWSSSHGEFLHFI